MSGFEPATVSALSPLTLVTLVTLVTITVGMTAAMLAWRERHEPGGTPLVAMLAGQTWWSVFFVLELQAPTLTTKVFWSDVQWVGVVVIPVAWLMFSLEYTGRDQFTRRHHVAILSIVPALTVLLAATGGSHDLIYVESELVVESGVVTLSRTHGPWFWVIAGYTYLLGLLGSIPLLSLVKSEARPFRGQSVALLIGTLAPWASNVLFLAGAIPIPGLDPTPVAFAISGVAYLGALTRFRLFGTSPSPNRQARRLVFEQMQEAAVVVDSHDFLVDMNQSAIEVFGKTPKEVLGVPAHEVIPEYETFPQTGSPSGYLTITGEGGDRQFDVVITRINNAFGRMTGRLITFHDIGDLLRQQQRLEVLNRVLRHNIRTETNIIYGYADFVAEDDTGEMAEMIKERALRIEEMGEKARRISDAFRRDDEPSEESLSDILGESVSTVRRQHPDVTIECAPVPPGISVPSVLELVFSNLIENAAVHNTNNNPRVWVHAHVEDHEARILVEDNGPGIDEYERSVLESGTETPLEHGSGLGLWLVKWATGIVGGRVTFGHNYPTGTIAIVHVPIRSEPGNGSDRSAGAAPSTRPRRTPVAIEDGSGERADSPDR